MAPWALLRPLILFLTGIHNMQYAYSIIGSIAGPLGISGKEGSFRGGVPKTSSSYQRS